MRTVFELIYIYFFIGEKVYIFSKKVILSQLFYNLQNIHHIYKVIYLFIFLMIFNYILLFIF